MTYENIEQMQTRRIDPSLIKAEDESDLPENPLARFNHYNDLIPMAWGQEKPPNFDLSDDSETTLIDNRMPDEKPDNYQQQQQEEEEEEEEVQVEKTEEEILSERWDTWRQRPWG